MIQEKVKCDIGIEESNDPRSYRQNSDKLKCLGFRPNNCVEDAINEIIFAYKDRGLRSKEENFTVEWMKSKNIV